MRASDVEAWALKIVDRVKAGEKVEDDRVELKREWPDAKRAARRIAGHANSARGDEILWLIGVDETGGVLGANEAELANWYPQIASRFDGGIAPPLLHHLNVPTDAGTISCTMAPAPISPQRAGEPLWKARWELARGEPRIHAES